MKQQGTMCRIIRAVIYFVVNTNGTLSLQEME